MFNDLWHRMRVVIRRGRVEGELDEELRFHLERQVEKYVQSGLNREEAQRRARVEFGGVELAKEECRDAGGVNFIESMLQDLRYGIRTLGKNPGFTAVAVLTLALGIGANTAVFTVVNGVLLRPMPFPEPERLVLISLTPRGGPFKWQPGVSDRDYLAFREQDQAFQRIASFTSRATANLTGAGDPVQIPVAYVTTDFFPVLQTNPEIGRGFLAEEEEPGRDNVVILSNQLWKERFGADSGILGRTLQLDGISRTVVGVMPTGFALPDVRLWMPLKIRIDAHNSFTRPVVGRLKPRVTEQQAQAELETFSDLQPLGPGESKRDRMPQIIPLKDLLVANIRPSLLVFAGAVAFVLLIACANVANLFLARAAGRGHEMALRSTLGAGRWRLVRQLLTESTLLSLAGGACGILITFWSVPALLALAPAGKVPRMEMIRMDGWVLAYTFAISVMTGIMFGLAPAFHATRRDASESLSQAGRSVTAGHERMRGALTVSEIALALVLLTGAGLMLKSFMRLRAVNPGFAPHSVMTITVDLPESTYRTAPQMRAFHARTLDELSGLPGVSASGAVNLLPLGGFLTMGTFQVEGSQRPPGFMVDKPCISPGYFKAMGMPLLRGREFTEADNDRAPGVVVVSQSVARTLWPGQDPILKRVSMEDEPKPEDWLTVVGVVEDVKQQGLTKGSDPAIYQAYLQISSPFFLSHMTFVVKTASSPESVASGIRTVLRSVDKNQPISIASMDSLVAATTAESRFQTRLLTAFAMVSLALTIAGIYGVLAYSVAQRTREIGVRMALGAQGGDVLGMVLRKALVLVFAGIVIGGAGAVALTRVLERFLFEVKPADLPTLAAVTAILALSALAACYMPARRAMRVDPMVALRYE
ncbi:MAG TPA: ABC transporter permease [Candidatus Acidoferrum sp.]|nr:ABC transporter permease [Candidatus Acidoferrum sp.]